MIRPFAHPPNALPRRRVAAFTLLELIISISISVILLAGLLSAMTLATRAIDTGNSPSANARSGSEALDWIESDVAYATSVQSSEYSLQLTVPDRDVPPDGSPESIRYTWTGFAGDPLLRRYNDGPDVVVVENVTELEFDQVYRLTAASHVPPPLDPSGWGYFGGDDGLLQADVLLVVSDAAVPSAQALARKSALESWSATVTLIGAGETQAAFDTAVAAADVAYVAQECDETALGLKLTNAPIGVVSEPYRMHDEFGFAEAVGTRAQITVEIIDTSHPITAGLPAGTMTVQEASRRLTGLDTPFAPSLVTLGEVNGDPSLAVLAAGGIRSDSTTSPSRRVNLPFGGDDFDFTLLNANGLGLVRRALNWASAPVISKQFGYTSEFTIGVTGVEKTQIATRATMPEVGTISSISAYVSAAGKKLRLAIYANTDSDEPGALIVESAEVQADGVGWQTLPVPDTVLAAGDYWLAVAFERDNQFYYQDSPGATRYVAHDAVRNNFLATWGTSDSSFGVSVSIHATYTPN